MDEKLIAALGAIPASQTSYQEWIAVGMALKHEGYDCSIWEQWSMNDSRYHKGECQRKWNSFGEASTPVTGGTIISMAREQGWKPFEGDGLIQWNDEISYDGREYKRAEEFNPVKEFRNYISILFDPDDHVCYNTASYQDADGKWKPSGKGAFDRTARQLIESLDKHPNDLGATIGDWKADSGAWVRFNALDGRGVKNENVTKFRYALVESDSMTIEEQNALYCKLKLPIAVMVNSGGKSLHAIVRVDAYDYKQYRERVDFMYSYLEKNGVTIDKQNRNPSRLSRLPGVTRAGKRQYITAVNIGCKNWEEWTEYINSPADGLPDVVSLADYKDNPPTLPEELIQGVLRCGHKMLISGSSKAGKSFLLMELCIAIAEGTQWLGFQCKKGRVLYVNLEIDPASCIMRFLNIYKALKLKPEHIDGLDVWNLRGHAIPLDMLVPKLVSRVKGKDYIAIVIDPIYKIQTGDENSASEMGAFCNLFDKICAETGCAVIYSHHHSKGAQGAKKAIDRASGSGVFARDPDAQLDMIQLELTEDMQNRLRDGKATAWRMECSLREFANFNPINFWFNYPIHLLDVNGSLDGAFSEGSIEASRAKNRKCTTPEERRASIVSAFEACSIEQPVTLSAMAEYIGVTERCVRDRLGELKNEYWVKSGIVGLKQKKENTEN